MAIIKNANSRNDPDLPLLAHLNALRSSLVFAALAWAACVVIAGVVSPQILAFIKAPAASNESLLQGLDLTSGFSTIMSIAMWAGTGLAFPFIVFAILKFVFPALSKKEKIILLSILVAGTCLFTVGVYLAYSQTLPLVVTAFQAINNWVGLPVETIRIEGYIEIALKTIIAFGLVFQLPVIIFVLGLFGVVTPAGLAQYRRFAIVIAFVLSMVLTPPDPLSQIIMAVPLCLLYEISILLLRCL